MLEYLREWRRERSVRDNVPAFMILHDSALDDLSRKLPQTPADLLHVSGIGEKKAAALGADILGALEAYRNGARASERETVKTSPAEETIRMLSEGLGFEDIARIRERRLQTVIDLVAELDCQVHAVVRPHLCALVAADFPQLASVGDDSTAVPAAPATAASVVPVHPRSVKRRVAEERTVRRVSAACRTRNGE